jgi:hypothetical protein
MKAILIIVTLALSIGVYAKTTITLTKSSAICAVNFESKKSSQRINKQKYLRFKISDIKLSDLAMSRGQLESQVDSQWLNTGEKYYISAYAKDKKGNYIGPKHIPLTIPPKGADYDRYLDVDIDEYLPCSCFRGVNKPSHCQSENDYSINKFRDRFGNWWQQTGKNSAKRIANEVGEGAHKVWEATKEGAKYLKEGWDNYQK